MSNFLKYIPWIGGSNKDNPSPDNDNDSSDNKNGSNEDNSNITIDNKSNSTTQKWEFGSSDDSFEDSNEPNSNEEVNIDDQSIPSEDIVEEKFKKEVIDANQISLLEKNLPIEKKWTLVLLLRQKRKSSKSPKQFIEIVDNYKEYSKTEEGLRTYLQNLEGLRTYASTGSLSWGNRFIRHHGVESLFKALEMIKGTSTQPLPDIQSQQFHRILESLYFIADMKSGNEYLRTTYERQRVETSTNFMKSLISYLTPNEEENNAILIQLIFALNESPTFAEDCIKYLSETNKKTNKNGFDTISEIISCRKKKEIEENKNKPSNSPQLSTSQNLNVSTKKKDNLQPKYLIENVCYLIKALCLKSADDLVTYFNLIIILNDSNIISNLKPIPENVYDSKDLYDQLSEQFRMCSKVFPKLGPYYINPFDEESLLKYCRANFNQSFMNIVLSLIDIQSNYALNSKSNEDSPFDEISNYLQTFLLECRYQLTHAPIASSVKLEDVAFSALNEAGVQFDNPSPNRVQTHLFELYEFYDKNWLKLPTKTVQHTSFAMDEVSDESLVTVDDYKKKVKKLEEKIDSLNRNLNALSKSASSFEVFSNLSQEFASSAASQGLIDIKSLKDSFQSMNNNNSSLLLDPNSNNENSSSVLTPPPPPPPPPPPTSTSDDQPPASSTTDVPPPPPPPPPPPGAPPPPPPPPPPPGAPPPPPPPPGAPPPPPGLGGSNLKPNVAPPKKMKPLFWTKIQQREVRDSVWEEIDDTKVDVDFDLLESYFGAQTTKPQGGNTTLVESAASNSDLSSSSEFKMKPKLVTFIDDTKSRSVQIMLTRFRFDIREICDKIKMMRNDFTDDQFAAIKSNLPTDEEIQQVKSYEGDAKLLGVCERYFTNLIKINGLNYHIELLDLDRSIDQRIEDLNSPLDCIVQALEQINNSKRFEDVLSFILKVGNIMNGGGSRGGAYGFKIDLLSKISDITSSKKGYTMMSFLVECFYQKQKGIGNKENGKEGSKNKDNNNKNKENNNSNNDDENNDIKDNKNNSNDDPKRDNSLLHFTDDLKAVLPASKADLSFVQKDFKQLNSTIEKLKSYVPQALKDMPDNDNYFSKFNEFQENHTADVMSVSDKLTRVNDLYRKTVKSFNEDAERINCQEFVNIFAKFIIDYEVELKDFIEKKEKEERIKAQLIEKAKIEEFNKKLIEQQSNLSYQHGQDIESLSQRGIIDFMLKTINKTSIQKDNAANNESIIKNVQSKRSQRIKRLINKK